MTNQPTTVRPRLADLARHAREFIVFADGLEEAGFVVFARRGRAIADELLRALDELAAERSARRALQERCEVQQDLLGRHAAEAITKATR